MEVLRIVYTARRGYMIPSNEEIYPLVEISEFLMTQGFKFCRASTADGISEITHSGDAPYYVVYRNLSTFRNCFVDDFYAEQENEKERSGGWISSLNYGHVDVYLKKDALRFCASVGGGVRVEWYGYTQQDEALIDRVDEKMRQILGNCSRVERQTQQLEKPLCSNWD